MQKNYDYHFDYIETLYSAPKTHLEVIKAYSHYLNTVVVVKVYSNIPVIDTSKMLIEAQYQMKFTHRNICKVLDVISEGPKGDQTLKIVLEPLEKDVKKEIEERIQQGRRYEERELLQFVIEVSGALLYMHSQGIAHRDIKPANVLVSSKGTYKLSDFGAAAAKFYEEAQNTLIGTPAYFSPELLYSYDRYKATGVVDSCYNPYASDVFSFGATIMSLALLRPFHSRELLKQGSIDEALIRQIPYSEGVKTLLRQMLAGASSPRPFIGFVHGMAQALWSSVEDPLFELLGESQDAYCVLCSTLVRDNGMSRTLPCCGQGRVCSEVCRMIYGRDGVTCRYCGGQQAWT